jgi:antitoxin (DNA-binding transcriptional repressor) of toxin-antitoxin stability system
MSGVSIADRKAAIAQLVAMRDQQQTEIVLAQARLRALDITLAMLRADDRPSPPRDMGEA